MTEEDKDDRYGLIGLQKADSGQESDNAVINEI